MAPKYHPTPLSGGDRKALAKELGKARAMANILAAQSVEMRAKGEAMIQQADRLLCESWNERMWSDGEPIDPSPTIDQAVNGGFPWLEIRCALRRHLDQLDVCPEGQGRRNHQRPRRVPHDGAERRGRRHPPEGHAGDLDNPGRSRGLDDGLSGRGPDPAAAASGLGAQNRRPRRQRRSRRVDNVTGENDDQAGPSPRLRKIIHVDMDAFYASVEQRDNPDLRGKPVAVGGSRERGVVAAASYEARKFGVRSAMPSVTAKRQCPDLIFVKPRFEVYKEVTAQIREIFAEHTPAIEPLSLDEAYLDVTENLQGIPLARDVALAIRANIKEVTGLNASAGISYNKFLAKLASDYRKPNGQYVITPEMGPAFVENLPVGKFHGIGPATGAKMNSIGLYTGLDIRNQSLDFMRANFGKAGAYYYWIS